MLEDYRSLENYKHIVHQYLEPDSWMNEYYQNVAIKDVYYSLYEKMAQMVDNLESDWDNA